MSLAIIGLVVVYSLAFAASLALLANPDPQRWAGWGPTGLTFGLAMSIVGLVAAVESRRVGLVVGLIGAAVAIAAMPWALYLLVPAPAVLAYRVVGARAVPVASDPAG